MKRPSEDNLELLFLSKEVFLQKGNSKTIRKLTKHCRSTWSMHNCVSFFNILFHSRTFVNPIIKLVHYSKMERKSHFDIWSEQSWETACFQSQTICDYDEWEILRCSRQILQRSLAVANCPWWPPGLAVIGRKCCYLRWTGASTPYIYISWAQRSVARGPIYTRLGR